MVMAIPRHKELLGTGATGKRVCAEMRILNVANNMVAPNLRQQRVRAILTKPLNKRTDRAPPRPLLLFLIVLLSY